MARIIRKVVQRKAERGCLCLGIDASLVGNAIAVVNHAGNVAWAHGWTDAKALQQRHKSFLSYYKIGDQSLEARLWRVRFMADWAVEAIDYYQGAADDTCQDMFVALEGYAFSRANNASSDLHELSGRIKQQLMARDIPFRIYSPTLLKKAWTGSGNADKAQMQMACFKRTGMDFTEITKGGDGLADAVLLAKLLHFETEVRAGRVELKELDKNVRAALLATSKAEPVALISRPLISMAPHWERPTISWGANAGTRPEGHGESD